MLLHSSKQACLTNGDISPAYHAEKPRVHHDDELTKEGDIIRPPHNAASVTMDKLKIKRIIVVDKQLSQFKSGYWDIELKFVFEYRVNFREANATIIESHLANSVHSTKLSLFGSVGTDMVIGTDLLKAFGDHSTFNAEPFVLVEAKALALNAQLYYPPVMLDGDNYPQATEVHVTVGLFSIVKLFRIVNLRVESRGFDIPDVCPPIPSPISPCAFFEDMDFPMDVFAPPQKPEFAAGLSLNIPSGE